jgi:MSHA biogenesis protein MshN
MSVIHSVLTRLDARGAPTPAAVGAMPTLTRSAQGASRRLLVMALAGAAAVGFVAFADWPTWLRSATAAQPAARPTPLAATQSALEATSAPTPTRAASATPIETKAATSAPPPVIAMPAIAAPTRAPSAAPAPVSRRVALAAPTREAAVAVPTEAAASAAPATIDKRAIALKPSQRAVLLLRQAHESAQAGQPRAAVAQAREALALDPTLAGARLLAAVLEHETGASERAAQLLRDGLAREPRDGAQALLLARVQIAQGDGSGALATLEQHPVRSAEADGLRGGILTQQGDYARALGAYESAARQQPANAMWWLGLGVALDGEGHAQRARQAYARALAIGLPRDDLTQYADRRLRGND